MSSEFLANIYEIDGYRFHLVTASVEAIDDNTDWILMVDMDTKELYGGLFERDTGFLKKYRRLEGQ